MEEKHQDHHHSCPCCLSRHRYVIADIALRFWFPYTHPFPNLHPHDVYFLMFINSFSKNFRICAPITKKKIDMLLSCFSSHQGTGVYWCYTLSLVESNKTFAAANVSLRVWIFYVVTLVVNFLCTGGCQVLCLSPAISLPPSYLSMPTLPPPSLLICLDDHSFIVISEYWLLLWLWLGLIAFKIWQIQRAVHKLGSLSTDLNYVAIIIVESGMSVILSVLPILLPLPYSSSLLMMVWLAVAQQEPYTPSG
jgi:hypothetical protein